MEIQNLKVRDYLEHLRRHPIPEIISDECMAALSNVEAKYGDTMTYMSGYEVRLGDPARYIDYIMNIDVPDIPNVQSLWYEIDYEQFAGNGEAAPCFFANTNWSMDNKECWDKFLPAFLGEQRAVNLREQFDRVIDKLPKGARIKQVGTMTSRGELDIMRLVIAFPSLESLILGLSDIGWSGDIQALRAVIENWQESKSFAIDIDLAETGVLSKIGIEIYSRWRNPLLFDKILFKLEQLNLCLPSKGEALRRWIRILPDGDPFIQTTVVYFKLNYKDGKISEAKGYFQQAPYVNHYYFNAYERPIFVEMELKNQNDTLDMNEALHWLNELRVNRVRQVRFIGNITEYEQLNKLLTHCKEHAINSTIVISSKVSKDWIAEIISVGVDGFIIDFDVLRYLQGLDFTKVRAKWYMQSDNVEELPQVVSTAEKLGIKELIITGMTPQKISNSYLDKQQLKQAAEVISNLKETQIQLTVDSCFSPLKAIMGGEDPKKNPNRGIERGCGAGRDRLCIHATGKLSPCIYSYEAESSDSLAEYWENSEALQKLRRVEKPAAESCKDCRYQRRCLPCQLKIQRKKV